MIIEYSRQEKAQMEVRDDCEDFRLRVVLEDGEIVILHVVRQETGAIEMRIDKSTMKKHFLDSLAQRYYDQHISLSRRPWFLALVELRFLGSILWPIENRRWRRLLPTVRRDCVIIAIPKNWPFDDEKTFNLGGQLTVMPRVTKGSEPYGYKLIASVALLQ